MVLSPAPSTICADAAPHGEAMFQHWLSACSDDPWAPLTPAAAEPYRFIWGAWLKFLAADEAPLALAAEPISQPMPNTHAWQTASAEQVLRFLNQGTRSQKQLDMPSDITRRRYWRVLERIYDHAALHQWISQHPLEAIAAQERPPSEDPKGAILSPRMWRALQRHIPAAVDLITARDRAVLFILMHLGLSSEEVRNLTLADLQWQYTPSPGLQTPWVQALHIHGERDMQTRTLEVPRAVALALQQWLGFRANYAPMHGEQALFCTRKAPMLSTHTVLHLVSKHLKATSASLPDETPPRMGPQIVRNTVIVQWLHSGLSVEQVLERSGLKTPHALGHLKHFVD